MPRLILFLAIAFLAVLLFRTLSGRGAAARRDDPAPAPPPPPQSQPQPGAEAMHQCAWCGVHMSGASAVTLPDGREYCSADHRDAARAAGPGGRA
jgi:uncharacterized protein